jgi:hypothetical protein
VYRCCVDPLLVSRGPIQPGVVATRNPTPRIAFSSTALENLAVDRGLGQIRVVGRCLELLLPDCRLALQLTLGRPHNPAIRYPALSGPIKVPGINHDSPDFTISTEVGDHI